MLWCMGVCVLIIDVATGTDSRQSSVKKSVNDITAYGELKH